jgi:hypothetical protein
MHSQGHYSHSSAALLQVAMIPSMEPSRAWLDMQRSAAQDADAGRLTVTQCSAGGCRCKGLTVAQAVDSALPVSSSRK